MEITRCESGDERQAIEILGVFKDRVVDLNAMAAFLDRESNYLLGAHIDGRPAGFALAYRLPRLDGDEDMLFLYEIEVDPEFRRRGVARHLIETMKAHAPGKFFVLTEASNEPAMRLYESCGGRRVGSDEVLFALGSRDD